MQSKQPEGRGPATLDLSDGSSLTADLVLWCAGARPNTACLDEALATAVRDEKGLIKAGAGASGALVCRRTWISLCHVFMGDVRPSHHHLAAYTPFLVVDIVRQFVRAVPPPLRTVPLL